MVQEEEDRVEVYSVCLEKPLPFQGLYDGIGKYSLQNDLEHPQPYSLSWLLGYNSKYRLFKTSFILALGAVLATYSELALLRRDGRLGNAVCGQKKAYLAKEACLFVLASEENGKRGKKTRPTVRIQVKSKSYLHSGDTKHVMAGIAMIALVFGVPWFLMNNRTKFNDEKEMRSERK
ncbi:hypothetical protein POTOM_031574 [Populus tomentosa]|uniref:Uncharacterized protein n=1 Tax=Populus tomentosa TaxID=118781 RepID=A0A8X7Z7Z0_POPTO|nr:hypothetical protein POTOM_031574 [Populus tomentosa]